MTCWYLIEQYAEILHKGNLLSPGKQPYKLVLMPEQQHGMLDLAMRKLCCVDVLSVVQKVISLVSRTVVAAALRMHTECTSLEFTLSITMTNCREGICTST